MRKIEIQVIVSRVNLTLKFPTKLQIGLNINGSEVLTNETVELKSSEAIFKLALSQNIQYKPKKQELQINRKIKKEYPLIGHVILYSVHAKRKMVLGQIALNLTDILENGQRIIKKIEKLEQCSNNSGLVDLQIKIIQKQSQNQETVTKQFEREQISQSEESKCDQIIKKSQSTPVYYPSVQTVTNLNNSIDMLPQKAMKNRFNRKPSLKENTHKERLIKRRKPSNEIQADKFQQFRRLQISTLDCQTPEVHSNAICYSNFLSSDDDQYIKSLKIRRDYCEPVEPSTLKQILPISETIESKFLQSIGSPKQSQSQLGLQKKVSILQKKLSLTEQYYKKEIQKYSRKVLQVQQQRQTFSIQISIKQDQIKDLKQQIFKIKSIYQCNSQLFDISDQHEPFTIIKLKQIISKLQQQKQDQELKINNLMTQLSKQKSKRINYQESVQTYYQRVQNDENTIEELKSQITQLNFIMKTLVQKHELSGNSLSTLKTIAIDNSIQQKIIIPQNIKIKQLQQTIENLKTKIDEHSQLNQQYNQFVIDRTKYLDDIKYLAESVDNLQKDRELQNYSIIEFGKQNQLLTEVLEQAEKQIFQLKSQLIEKNSVHKINQENIKQFQKQLSEKYSIIYNLQSSLKNQKQKSRSLSRSIDNKNNLGRMLQFSFNQQCNHNFTPLVNKVKQISASVHKSRFEALKNINQKIKDPAQMNAIKHYNLIQSLLKRFITTLEQSIQKITATRSPRGSMTKFEQTYV